MCVCDRVKINSEAITHNDTRRNATLSCWLFGSRSTFAPRSMSRTTLRASDRFRIIYFFFSRHVVHTCNPLTLTLAIDYDTDDKHTRLVSIFFFFFIAWLDWSTNVDIDFERNLMYSFTIDSGMLWYRQTTSRQLILSATFRQYSSSKQ